MSSCSNLGCSCFFFFCVCSANRSSTLDGIQQMGEWGFPAKCFSLLLLRLLKHLVRNRASPWDQPTAQWPVLIHDTMPQQPLLSNGVKTERFYTWNMKKSDIRASALFYGAAEREHLMTKQQRSDRLKLIMEMCSFSPPLFCCLTTWNSWDLAFLFCSLHHKSASVITDVIIPALFVNGF